MRQLFKSRGENKFNTDYNIDWIKNCLEMFTFVNYGEKKKNQHSDQKY